MKKIFLFFVAHIAYSINELNLSALKIIYFCTNYFTELLFRLYLEYKIKFLPIIQNTAEPPPAIKNNGTDKNPAPQYNWAALNCLPVFEKKILIKKLVFKN